MNINAKKINLTLFLFALTFFFAACREEKTVLTMDDYETIKINYGNFEDELNFFDMADIGEFNCGTCMRDGFFYIANAESKKIMGFNSYADLLTLYFNDQTNPRPSFYDEDFASVSTRKAVAYPFNKISEIAVDSRKYMYVADVISVDRQEVSEEDGTIYNQMILRFDSSGRYTGYLGQQGFGGTPFPYIKKLYATTNNEFVVLCETASGLQIYWFTEDGSLVKKLNLEECFNYELYQPRTSVNELWQLIKNAVPDPDERKIYMQVDVVSSSSGQGSEGKSQINFLESYLYTIDLESGLTEKGLQLPSYQDQATNVDGQNYTIPYELLGITDFGWLFFMVSTDKGFALAMMQADGQRILKRTINVDRRDSLYYSFCLGNTGILSMLNAKEDYAELCWWRTDSIIQSVLQN